MGVTMQANMHEAKSKLSQLVDSVIDGEEVVIARAGRPVAKLVPFHAPQKRQRGILKGQIEISNEFDSDEVNQEIAEEFGI